MRPLGPPRGIPHAVGPVALAVSDHAKATMMLVEMMVFVVLLLVAYFYAWGKGVFRWD